MTRGMDTKRGSEWADTDAEFVTFNLHCCETCTAAYLCFTGVTSAGVMGSSLSIIAHSLQTVARENARVCVGK